MRVDFLGLEAFISIAHWGSFSRAAGHLNLSQTALSHRLRRLEEDLGVKLLVRTTRSVTLSAAGLELLPTARRLVAELTASLDGMRAAARGRQERLAIGCLPTIANHHLPSILTEFEASYPNLSVRVFDNSATEIVSLVAAGEAEFGVTIVSTDRWDLEITPLMKEPFVLVCPANHAFAGNASVTWSALEGVPLIRISQQTGNRILIDDALGNRRDTMTWRYEVQHVSTALSMVRAGVGLTIVPQLGVDLAKDAGLAAVSLRNPGITRTVGIVTRRGYPLSAAAESLFLLLETRLRKVIPQTRKAS